MLNKYRKEKYIAQIKSAKGWSYRVRYKNIDKTFSEEVYGQVAFKRAVNFRNKILVEPFESNTELLVKDVYNEMVKFYNLRAETKRKYDINVRKYLNSYIDMPIVRVKTSDIIECLNAMVNDCSDDTIQRVLSMWRKMFYMAIAKEYISKDVTFGIKAPKSHKIASPRKVIRIDKQFINDLSSLCETKLNNPIEQQQLPVILWTLYYTGMRPCELVALNKSDIDFKANVIHITKEIGSNLVENNVVRQCKTTMSVRDIPIANDLKPHLKKIMTLTDNDILFPNTKGDYYQTRLLHNKYHNLAKKYLDIPFNMYALRHNFSTQLITNTDIRTIQELMGHKNPQMSIQYSRSNDNHKKVALNNL